MQIKTMMNCYNVTYKHSLIYEKYILSWDEYNRLQLDFLGPYLFL
jgi:hypothetical protein